MTIHSCRITSLLVKNHPNFRNHLPSKEVNATMLTKLTSLSSSKIAIGLVIIPLAIPITYLVYLDRVVSSRFKTVTGVRDKKKDPSSSTPSDLTKPISLPEEVRSEDPDQSWVLAYERVVSEPQAMAPSPDEEDLPAFVTNYVRATMTAFSWTPQAFLLRASVPGTGDDRAALRKTFDTPFIQGLGFRVGDRINGFWKVVYRGDGGVKGNERVEMALDAPVGYSGPLVRGVVVAGAEVRADGRVVFVNETWMWRQQGEAPVLLERGFGRWFHAVLAGWLVMKGLMAVTGKRKPE